MRFVKNIMMTSLVSAVFMVSSAYAAPHHLSGHSYAKKSHAHHVKSAVRTHHAKVAPKAAVVAAPAASAGSHQLPLPVANAKLTS